MVWDSVAAAVTGRRSWLLALAAAALGAALMVLIGGNAAAGQSPQSVPVDAQSAQVDALARQFPGGDKAPVIVVISRTDGGALVASD
ncbi:MMPL family transporter, partial [Mycobacterium colombiense]